MKSCAAASLLLEANFLVGRHGTLGRALLKPRFGNQHGTGTGTAHPPVSISYCKSMRIYIICISRLIQSIGNGSIHQLPGKLYFMVRQIPLGLTGI